MRSCALASGSSGNCFYIEKDNTAVLIDVGISAKRIIERMIMLKLNPDKIKAIFITHEHSDHISGADVLARKLNLPVYATKGTLKNGKICSSHELIRVIKNNACVRIGKLNINSFSKSHKAAEPVSFTIEDQNNCVSVITDAGYACENINLRIASSDVLFLESNHDIAMLEKGPYPQFLKEWVTSDSGHLSNSQAAQAVTQHATKKLKHIILSHLSKTNNTPLIALMEFQETLKQRNDIAPKVSLSLAHQPSELFEI